MYYKYVHPFKDGLAVVLLDKMYGVINKSGNYVIEPKYSFIGAPRCGRMIFEVVEDKEDKDSIMPVNHRKLQGIVSYDGTVILEPSTTILDPSGYSDDMLGFTAPDGKRGFLDLEGKVAIPAIYDSTMVFNEGLCAVMQKLKKKVPNPELKRGWSHRTYKMWGVIDKKGRAIIPFNYDYISSFSEGMAPARHNGAWTYIDTSGNMIGEDIL
jgi:hypothetical protein